MPTFVADAEGSQVQAQPKVAQQIESGGLGGDLQAAISPATPGLALISPKLVQKILSGDFIDMCELLPETWRVEEPKEGCCRSTRPKRGLVTDIALWTECFASLVAVLTTKYPEKAPQFMGYLRTIVRASRNFEGSAWASYDAAYRRQSANRRSLEWAVIDPTIYNEAFTGRAKLLPRCQYCLAETHMARDCSYVPTEEPPPAKLPRIVQGVAGPSQHLQWSGAGDRHNARVVEICDRYNQPEGNKCIFKWCRFAHVCARCRSGPHPASGCNRCQGWPAAELR